MLLSCNDISLSLCCQQFECYYLHKFEDEMVFEFHSTKNTDEVVCSVCGGKVHIYDNYTTRIKDIPFYVGKRDNKKMNPKVPASRFIALYGEEIATKLSITVIDPNSVILNGSLFNKK